MAHSAGLVERLSPLDPASVGPIDSYWPNNSNELPNKRGQWVFELNHGFVVMPGLTDEGRNTQYVVAPNNFLPPAGRPSDVRTVGFQVNIQSSAVFLLPNFRRIPTRRIAQNARSYSAAIAIGAGCDRTSNNCFRLAWAASRLASLTGPKPLI
jgi:hypothetical protein